MIYAANTVYTHTHKKVYANKILMSHFSCESIIPQHSGENWSRLWYTKMRHRQGKPGCFVVFRGRSFLSLSSLLVRLMKRRHSCLFLRFIFIHLFCFVSFVDLPLWTDGRLCWLSQRGSQFPVVATSIVCRRIDPKQPQQHTQQQQQPL